jgi:hypothetical protein
MQPFLAWNRDEVRQGRLPLWNPYNGWGAPHLANYQSAVFSPYSLPFYLLDFRAALLTAACLKLVSLGWFTYLFLRRLALAHAAALVGAVAYAFGGYHVVWLGWAHVGAAIGLPAGAYCVERALRAGRPGLDGRAPALIGLTLALAAGLLAGHPETTFYSLLLLGAYALVRLLTAGPSWRWRGAAAGQFLAAAALALALCAAQLLPFAEYLRHSAALAERSTGPFAFAGGVPTFMPHFAPLLAFPDLLGNPALRYDEPVMLRVTNYVEANGHYLGLIALFLAGLGLAGARRSAPAACFGGAAAVWLLYVYNVGGFGEVVSRLPVFGVAVPARSQEVWLFSLSCLAAFGAQRLLDGAGPDRAGRRRMGRAGVGGLAGWGLALLAVALAGAWALLDWAARQPGNAVTSGAARAVVGPHLAVVGLTTGAAVAVVVATLALPRLRRSPRAPAALGAALIGLIFLQTGFLLRDFNPTVEERLVFPTSPALAAVRARVGDGQTLWLDGAKLPANTNLWYRLRTPSNHDAFGVGSYEALHRALVDQWHPAEEHTARPRSLRGLQLLGIQHVATAQSYPGARRVIDLAPADPARGRATPILPDRPLTQRFRATEGGLSVVTFRLTSFGRANVCTVRAALEDERTGQILAERSVACTSVDDRLPVVLPIPPQPASGGRWYRLRLTSPDATEASAVGAVYLPRGQGTGFRAGPPGGDMLIGQLVFDAFAAIPDLEPVWAGEGISLFRVPGALPRFFTVGHGVTARDDADALALLQRPDFDPRTAVVLHRPPAAGGVGRADAEPAGTGGVTVLADEPGRVRLRVERPGAGWLVALHSWQPGWVARVNGQAADLERANVGFVAVATPAGTSEVELSYEPASVRWGLAISGTALLTLVALLGLVGWRRRSAARGGST